MTAGRRAVNGDMLYGHMSVEFLIIERELLLDSLGILSGYMDKLPAEQRKAAFAGIHQTYANVKLYQVEPADLPVLHYAVGLNKTLLDMTSKMLPAQERSGVDSEIQKHGQLLIRIEREAKEHSVTIPVADYMPLLTR